MSTRATVLVVEDDQALRELILGSLGEWGFKAHEACDGMQALAMLAAHEPDIVLSDVAMPGMTGRELLPEVRARWPEVPVILMTAFAQVHEAVAAVQAGAFDYISKPFTLAGLRVKLDDALRLRQLRRMAAEEAGHDGASDEVIVARSAAMQAVVATIRRAATSDASVLLTGESGTGKELLARSLHARSRRARAPFLAVNCSAIPEGLLESQLFGYRRGAFTDAREDRRGLVLETSGGTLLLDEIGDMPMALQSKLLRVIQEREVHPIGASSPVPVDIRWVATTHRDLSALVAEGRFRADLLYRLDVIHVAVPPLRSRPADIPDLVTAFVGKYARTLHRPACRVSPDAMDVLQRHSWPGNVRELQNVIERALVLGTGDILGVHDLPAHLRAASSRPEPAPQGPTRALADVEREHVLATLRLVGGNKAAAARMLGMDRTTLYRKLAEYGEN